MPTEHFKVENKQANRLFDPLAIDQQHIWHPYTQHAVADVPWLVTKAKDEFIFATDDEGKERKLIDGISSWWVNIHGHSNDYINQKIKDQLDNFAQVIFANFTHKPAAELVAKLLPLLPQQDKTRIIDEEHKLSKVFFSDNGSSAVEVGIKMAIQHWFNQGQEQRKRIIAFKDSYHGDTIGSMSSSDTPIFHQAFKSILFPVDFVNSPAAKFTEKFAHLAKEHNAKLQERICLEQIEELIEKHPDEIAAVLIEPLIQGAGGMKFHNEEFLQKLRALCTRANIILIFDEVFTGFGRTGENFAATRAEVVPDIICLSKALTAGYLPLGLTATNNKIYSAFHSSDRLKTFFHGHSFTGNALSITAASAGLDLYINEDRIADVKFIEDYAKRQIEQNKLEKLSIIKDIRIKGAITVIEFQDTTDNYLSDLATKLKASFLEKDILIRPLGNVLYFMPPYTISMDSLKHFFTTLVEICQRLEK